MPGTVTAAALIIGNEILSGRTQDQNLSFLGARLGELGIRLKEARVVSDDAEDIAAALDVLRARYDYVFTTGGIGPTHDDITADSVARAFGVGIDYHPEVYSMLKAWFESKGLQANEARMRMARIPDGASVLDNELTLAPGFQIENVFVLAGVPSIARKMFDGAKKRLSGGAPMRSRAIKVHVGEGTVAEQLGAIQAAFPDIDIGSYPWSEDGAYGTSLVMRGTQPGRVDEVFAEVFDMAKRLGGAPREE